MVLSATPSDVEAKHRMFGTLNGCVVLAGPGVAGALFGSAGAGLNLLFRALGLSSGHVLQRSRID